MFDEYKYGSELDMTFNVVDRLCKEFPDSLVITGQANVLAQKPYRIREVHKKNGLDMSFFSAVLFTIAYTRAEYAAMRAEKFDLLYHVRPFSIGSTFNLIPLLGLHKDVPFVIGPFTLPYEKAEAGGRNIFVRALAKILRGVMDPFLHALSIATVRRADAVMVDDKPTKDYLMRYIPEEKIHFAPTGKDMHAYLPGSKKDPGGPPRILVVGSLIRRKGIDLSIRAMPLVLKKFPEARLVILGEGEERERLMSLAGKLGVAGNVDFHGHVDHSGVAQHYRSSDVFVHMARQERFASVYIEALASGLPVVSSDNNAARHILNAPGEQIVPQEDWQALGEKLVALLENPALREKQASENRRYFETTFDFETVIIPKILGIIRSVLRDSSVAKHRS